MNAMLCLDIETIPSINNDRIAAMAAKRDMDPVTFASLCPPLAQVVCVGMQNTDTGGTQCFVVGDMLPPSEVIVLCVDEADLLAKVNKTVDKYDGLLTFAGRSFDVPCLFHRSKINGIEPAKLFTSSAWQKPWELRPHVDLLNAMTFGGAMGKYSLEAFCIAYGVESPKAAGDGSNVAQLFAEGKTAELAEYCLGDVKATCELYKRWSSK